MILNEKHVLFRFDVSPSIGAGHMSRCLVLAENLTQKGYSIVVLLKTKQSPISQGWRKVSNNIIELDWDADPVIETNKIIELYRHFNCDFAVVDHYDVTSDYQQRLIEGKIKWLQFDSHAKIDLYANWVLHASPAATDELYRPLVKNPKTRLLLGTKYALLRRDFRIQRDKVKIRNQIKKIVICFGGGDDRDATLKILKAIEKIPEKKDIRFDIVVSNTNKDLKKIKSFLTGSSLKNNHRLHIQTKIIHKLFSQADIGIISGGMLSYEAASLGLPTIGICIADNQKINNIGWEKAGASLSVGEIDSFDQDQFIHVISTLLNDDEKIQKMSFRAFELVDAIGSQRVVKELLK